MKGKDRCTLHVHPADAERLGLADGGPARISVDAPGEIEAPVEVTDAIMPGVVSLPHGWGHDLAGVELAVAGAHAGREQQPPRRRGQVDPLSGNAVLNGIPVELEPARVRVAV